MSKFIPRGERGHFKRLGVMMEPDAIQGLKQASLKLQCDGVQGIDVSALVRYAVDEFLRDLPNKRWE